MTALLELEGELRAGAAPARPEAPAQPFTLAADTQGPAPSVPNSPVPPKPETLAAARPAPPSPAAPEAANPPAPKLAQAEGVLPELNLAITPDSKADTGAESSGHTTRPAFAGQTQEGGKS